uniref:Malignant T-cell-amplified sequence 1-like n=1 Tax=Ciona intestinalis TaxID=7719 RepID=F6WUG3_CIOIN|nr:malignant T-cell-amplified sequence 1-like [Ciona intestinalis]|eukprot:XP_002131639.1 malignant T-cell-amplified sequence 1-like [Ciona intestinalis]
MFRKFDESENISSTNQLKSSVQRQIRNTILEQMPSIEPYLGDLWHKKENAKVIKCHDHIEILTVGTEPLFFKQRDSPWYPTLKLLHKYPFILPKQQVDRGAIKFVLSGANIMCPGLTSPGADLNMETEVNKAVAVHAEGKINSLAIGLMKMSPQKISEVNKGIGIDTIHYLNDGLWHLKIVK